MMGFVSGTLGFSCFDNLACQAEFDTIGLVVCSWLLCVCLWCCWGLCLLRCGFVLGGLCICIVAVGHVCHMGLPSGEGHASLCSEWRFD